MRKLLKITACLAILNAGAQTTEELKAQISGAMKSVEEKHYGEANLQLQQAMNSLGMVVGQEVLNSLPAELKGMKPDAGMDRVIPSGVPGTGTSVQRSFSGVGKRIFINITLQSQNASQLTLMLSNPAYAAAIADQKVVMVGKRRGLLRLNKDAKSAELQLVSGQNLLMLNADGIINTESEMIDLASKIDMNRVDEMTGK
jgi:hypothetical protein